MDLVSAKQDAADTKSVQHCLLEYDSQKIRREIPIGWWLRQATHQQHPTQQKS